VESHTPKCEIGGRERGRSHASKKRKTLQSVKFPRLYVRTHVRESVRREEEWRMSGGLSPREGEVE
jgi:hypothetical protein